MQSKFAAKRVGTLNKFFTKISVGELLAEQIDSKDPGNVLDLGAGEGSLCASVVRRWAGIEVVTVDMDPSTKCALSRNLQKEGCVVHRHHVHDALNLNLSSVLGGREQFDLAVCNPPFFNPPWSSDHASILRNGELEDAYASTSEVTAELLFLAQCLDQVKSGGKLAIIVPDSLITTSRAKSFRRTLLRNHTVEKVIQLPLNSFLETDAQCFLIIMQKGFGPTRNLQLLNVEAGQVVSQVVEISGKVAENRMDYNFHSLRYERHEAHTTLRKLGADVFRGSISTVQRKAADYPVFHTSDYKDIIEGRIVLPDEADLSQMGKIVAEAGDILLARVDRNLHEKIGVVLCGSAIITDCVYRIRLPEHFRALAYDALCSQTGRANLRALTKGVGARLIGKSDLLDMPLYANEI